LNNGFKHGDALSPLLFKFAVECVVRRVQVKRDSSKLNGTYQFLVYADGVNILGGSIHTIKKNTEALVVASKETGVEESSDKSKYMVISRDQNSGLSGNIKIGNSSQERKEQFKYLGTTLANPHSIQEEIKSSLKSGNTCYHSVPNLRLPICYPTI